jgi:hypothetical protein
LCSQVPEAIQIREALLAKLEAIKMPANALDLITCHFGVSAVAEMTGRKMRFVPAVGGGSRWEARATAGVSHDHINISEKDAFLAGNKRIAIISDAASSGEDGHWSIADHPSRSTTATQPHLFYF